MQWPCASLPGASLRDRTTIRVGGPVEWLLEPASPDELREVVALARERDFEIRVLGGGANVIIEDQGLGGVAIGTERLNRVFRPVGMDGEIGDGLSGELPAARMALPPPAQDPRLVAWARAPLPKLCRAARDLGFSGLEKMSGVPGQLGGGIAMNAGGKDPDGTLWQMSDVVERIRVVDRDGEFMDIHREEWNPAYRDGRLEERIVVGAVLRFEPRPKPEVVERSKDYLRKKNAVQPVSEKSAGCIWKNPDPEISDGRTAGKLVDGAGAKGMRSGDAVISERHGNFLVNAGSASASDVFGLIERVEAIVLESTGVPLEREVRLWRSERTD